MGFLIILSNIIQDYIIRTELESASIKAYSRTVMIEQHTGEYYSSLRDLESMIPGRLEIFEDYSEFPGRVFLLDGKQKVYYDSGGEYSEEVLPIEFVKNSYDLNEGDNQTYYTAQRLHLMYTTLPFQLKNGERVSVLLIEDISIVFQKARDIVEKLLVFGIPFTVGMGLLVMFAGAQILAPLDKLNDAVEAMTRGHYDHRIELGEADDELQVISRSFNTLAGRLHEIDKHQSEFVSNVSHELKTPIAAMKIISQSLVDAKDSIDKEVIFDFLDDISTEADRLSEIVEDLLFMATMQKRDVTLKLELRPISVAMEESIRILQPLANEKHISIVVEQMEKVIAEFDYNKIKQVFINLISNAIKYTEEGGQVKINLFSKRNDIIIRIQDNGIGIPPDELPYIFDRFFRVDKHRSRKEGGTGLGLNISKQIITLHSGTIEVESQVDSGTIFIVTLPKRYRV